MSKKKDKRQALLQKGKETYENMNAMQKGELLTALIQLYHDKPSQQTLMPIMQCLMDNIPVGVPMKVSEEDMKVIEEAKARRDPNPTKVTMKTLILKKPEGGNYMPVFSRRSEVPDEFFGKYYWLQMPFKECAKLVKKMESVDEIIINTFSQKLILPQQALESITLVDELRPSDDK